MWEREEGRYEQSPSYCRDKGEGGDPPRDSGKSQVTFALEMGLLESSGTLCGCDT